MTDRMLWEAAVYSLLALFSYSAAAAWSASTVSNASQSPSRVGAPAANVLDSLASHLMPRPSVLAAQRAALDRYFQSTGSNISDIRVIRSAMFLSDEIDRAMRGTDLPGQNIGWRPYNRFFAEGVEDLFTNVPSGRSMLTLPTPADDPALRAQAVQHPNLIVDPVPLRFYGESTDARPEDGGS